MAFPPRRRSARAEPSLAPAAPARDAVPLRPAAPRAVTRPGLADAGAEREPARLSIEPRHGAETPSISLTAADRIVISSEFTSGGKTRKERSGLRVLGFVLLLALAAIGAYSLYHEASAFLP